MEKHSSSRARRLLCRSGERKNGGGGCGQRCFEPRRRRNGVGVQLDADTRRRGGEGPGDVVEGGAWSAARPDRSDTGSGSSSRSPHAWGKIGEGEPLTGGAAWHSTGTRSNEFDSNSNFKRI
jgi:hypothetical protein